MTNQPFQYYIHDDSDAFRLELSGALSGAGAQSVHEAWRTALSILRGRRVIVDITFVTQADSHGRALLVLWRRHRAGIIACSVNSRRLAAAALGEPFPEPPSKPGLIQRLQAFFRRGRTDIAGIPAGAENPNGNSASMHDIEGGYAALTDSRGLECRVRNT